MSLADEAYFMQFKLLANDRIDELKEALKGAANAAHYGDFGCSHTGTLDDCQNMQCKHYREVLKKCEKLK